MFIIDMMKEPDNPCLTCGACCAAFRVSFYWAETDPHYPNAVPEDYVEKLTPLRAVMRGTNQSHPRCDALIGDVGIAVRCAIYERRPSPCREVNISWNHGKPDEKCDRARMACGLLPFPSDRQKNDGHK